MKVDFRRFAKRLARRFHQFLLIWAIGVAAFVYGYGVHARQWFPYESIKQAQLAWQVLRLKLDSGRVREIAGWSDLSPSEAVKRRVAVKEPVDDGSAFLMTGGMGQYLDYCPENGCMAVILGRDGRLLHAYPYRPEELTTKRIVDLPYANIEHDDSKDTSIFGLTVLPDGDLIVVYDFDHTQPNGGGIARVDKDGHIVWYRRDYSNHWPKLTERNEIVSISQTLGPAHISIDKDNALGFDCPTGVFTDLVRVLDTDGRVKEEIPLFEALLASPYRNYMLSSMDSATLEKNHCDPLHSNSVIEVGKELAARLSNVQPDDLLVSVRNISALVILGRTDHRIKYFFNGTFLFQHSAQIATGGNILLFDNYGGSSARGPSRVLLYDPVTGDERTVFPTDATPADAATASLIRGNINISADGTRAIVAFTQSSRAYEIRLTDGAILTSFDNLHDVHSLAQFKNDAQHMRYFHQTGVYYVSPRLLN